MNGNTAFCRQRIISLFSVAQFGMVYHASAHCERSSNYLFTRISTVLNSLGIRVIPESLLIEVSGYFVSRLSTITALPMTTGKLFG